MRNNEVNIRLLNTLTEAAINADFAREENEWAEREDAQFELSPAFERGMGRLLRRHRRALAMRRHRKSLLSAAAALMTLFLVFTAGMITADAFRIRVLNTFVQVFDKFIKTEIGEQPTGEVDQMVHKLHLPTYLPDGFLQVSIEKFDSFSITRFKNSAGIEIVLRESDVELLPAISEDGEGIIKTIVDINGVNALMIENTKEQVVSIQFITDTTVVLLRGQVDTHEMLKIAKGLKKNL